MQDVDQVSRFEMTMQMTASDSCIGIIIDLDLVFWIIVWAIDATKRSLFLHEIRWDKLW